MQNIYQKEALLAKIETVLFETVVIGSRDNRYLYLICLFIKRQSPNLETQNKRNVQASKSQRIYSQPQFLRMFNRQSKPKATFRRKRGKKGRCNLIIFNVKLVSLNKETVSKFGPKFPRMPS